MIKSLLKNTPIYTPLLIAKRYLDNLLNKRHPLQNVKTDNRYDLIRLGSDYGGWTFVDNSSLYGGTIISAGLGEDASFDIEFASKYDAKVIMIDPTPRAIDHFNFISKNIGDIIEFKNEHAPKQNALSYDLSVMHQSQLVLDTRALWSEAGRIRFYEPINTRHVSHSIVNFQNDYSRSTPYIEVDSCSVRQLLHDHNEDPALVKLLKLDIEGAEIEVIESMICDGFMPEQICVEFDELSKPSIKAFDRVTEVNKLLETNGYTCIYTDGNTDFLYYRTND
tara:strand:- start:2756 stop:3592 length:837 start_codon:yes stop_codon:yes gene_type:complete